MYQYDRHFALWYRDALLKNPTLVKRLWIVASKLAQISLSSSHLRFNFLVFKTHDNKSWIFAVNVYPAQEVFFE